MIYEGKITHILPQELVGANQIPKQTIIIEENTDKEWKGGIAVDFLKDKTSLIQDLSVGELVKAHLNFRVNEYKGKWYNGVTCWKIEKASSNGSASNSPAGESTFQPASYDENLPF